MPQSAAQHRVSGAWLGNRPVKLLRPLPALLRRDELEVTPLLFGDHYRFFGARFQILPAVLRPSRTLAQRGVFASDVDILRLAKRYAFLRSWPVWRKRTGRR